jgi:isopentenyl diphosphate isomerase/L-lactate dehydrogenase-like FMN-dependent dehydrogenase
MFADGGINHYGDIAKALVAGADWVMAGSMFKLDVETQKKEVWDKCIELTGYETGKTIYHNQTNPINFSNISWGGVNE